MVGIRTRARRVGKEILDTMNGVQSWRRVYERKKEKETERKNTSDVVTSCHVNMFILNKKTIIVWAWIYKEINIQTERQTWLNNWLRLPLIDWLIDWVLYYTLQNERDRQTERWRDTHTLLMTDKQTNRLNQKSNMYHFNWLIDWPINW